jgi:hypothetical protein
MLDTPALLYRLLATGPNRTIRRVEESRVLRVYIVPERSCSVDVNRQTLRISWPALTDQTIDSAERFAYALLCALQEAHKTPDERGQTHVDIA